jgi:hypothetical protein
MIESLGRYLNRNILVSIPSLFEDDRPHRCLLLGIEVSGVWLKGLPLAKNFPDQNSGDRIFVPFAQIHYLTPFDQARLQEPPKHDNKDRSMHKEKRREKDAGKTKRGKA